MCSGGRLLAPEESNGVEAAEAAELEAAATPTGPLVADPGAQAPERSETSVRACCAPNSAVRGQSHQECGLHVAVAVVDAAPVFDQKGVGTLRIEHSTDRCCKSKQKPASHNISRNLPILEIFLNVSKCCLE